MSDAETVAERIKEYVTQNWAESNRALLLSKIGARLRRDEPNSVAIIGKSLRTFIDKIPDIVVIQHPSIRERVGAVPADAAESSSPEILLAQNTVEFSRPPLRRDFWEAFYRPITGHRFVLLHKSETGGFSVDDFDLPPQTSEVAIEIFQSDLNSDSKYLSRTDAIWEKIRAWCQRNNLKIDQFIQKKQMQGQGPPKDDSNLLLRAIESLSVEDQRRISIPLDILIKIIGS